MAAPASGNEPLLNVPNLLSLARIPLAIALFICIVHQLWLVGLILFLVACATDWLDGWWARRYGPLTLVGRNLDPLADKILVCGSFIYLIPVVSAGILPWMVTVIVVRELLVTGLRGMVEATGKKFGADWFGKLKMGLQCAVLIGVLLIQWWRAGRFLPRDPEPPGTTRDRIAVADDRGHGRQRRAVHHQGDPVAEVSGPGRGLGLTTRQRTVEARAGRGVRLPRWIHPLRHCRRGRRRLREVMSKVKRRLGPRGTEPPFTVTVLEGRRTRRVPRASPARFRWPRARPRLRPAHRGVPGAGRPRGCGPCASRRAPS